MSAGDLRRLPMLVGVLASSISFEGKSSNGGEKAAATGPNNLIKSQLGRSAQGMEHSPDSLTAETSTIVRESARTLSLRLSERKLLLATVDILCANLALGVAIAWRFEEPLVWAFTSKPIWYFVLTSVWIIVSLMLGSYDLRRAALLKSGAATGVATSLVVGIVYLLIPFITPALPTSRLSLVIFLGAMVGTVTAWRLAYALFLVSPTLRRRVIVVGAGWAGQTIVKAISENASVEYELVGFVDDGLDKRGEVIQALPVLGSRHDLASLLTLTGTYEIIVAITQPDRMHPELFEIIMNCHERGIQVTQMPALFEQLTGRVPVEHAGRNLYVVLPLNGYPSHLQRIVKRLVDLAIGLTGIAVMVPLLPFVWVALRLDGTGPVFYRQARVGQGGKLFDLLKFRTMVPDAEVNGPRWAEENDERITRAGRILRSLHIDEIPQAINILRGELSFIGPRPERPEFVEQLAKQIPFYRARHALKPGVTGWAQVNYRYGASVEDALVKLQYDLYYIKHQSVWLDMVILIKTIATVLTLGGR